MASEMIESCSHAGQREECQNYCFHPLNMRPPLTHRGKEPPLNMRPPLTHQGKEPQLAHRGKALYVALVIGAFGRYEMPSSPP
jgi:hypothetical protein